MCRHTHSRADRDSTTPTTAVRRVWLSLDDQPALVATMLHHLRGFTVHIRHPQFSGDAKVVSAEPTKLVVTPHTANGFARPTELDPRHLEYLHVYR